MHRFFLPPECIKGDKVIFPDKVSHQIKHVLRLSPGRRVMVLDNAGKEYEVELALVSREAVNGIVKTRRSVQAEITVQIVLYLCLTQREKFEWMLQKCTEIGAAGFVPVISNRCLVRDINEVEKKYSRWERIIREAAEQSGRNNLPMLYPVTSLDRALPDSGREGTLSLILWESEQELSLRKALRSSGHIVEGKRSIKSIDILVGPEGGFAEEEVNAARFAGFLPVSIGKRILRMETAAIVSTALILYELGEMG